MPGSGGVKSVAMLIGSLPLIPFPPIARLGAGPVRLLIHSPIHPRPTRPVARIFKVASNLHVLNPGADDLPPDPWSQEVWGRVLRGFIFAFLSFAVVPASLRPLRPLNLLELAPLLPFGYDPSHALPQFPSCPSGLFEILARAVHHVLDRCILMSVKVV